MVRWFNPNTDVRIEKVGIYEVVYSPLLGTATVKKPGLLVPEVVFEADDPAAFENLTPYQASLLRGRLITTE